jgi:hypothetical protein
MRFRQNTNTCQDNRLLCKGPNRRAPEYRGVLTFTSSRFLSDRNIKILFVLSRKSNQVMVIAKGDYFRVKQVRRIF